MTRNIAIIARRANAVSETFIQAHKDYLTGNIFFLFGGPKGADFPTHAEDTGRLLSKHSLGIRLVRKVLARVGMKFYPFPRIQDVEQYFNTHQVNVVLAEYGMTGAMITPVVKNLQIPLIVHFHGFDAHNEDIYRRFEKQYTEMFAYASYFVSVSTTMTERLQALGAPAEKLVYNPYGPRHDFFRLTPSFDSNLFVALGRFVDKKAPHLTLAAFKQVVEHDPAARLLMIGEGHLLSMCKNLTHNWGLAEVVSFPGALPHDRIKSLLADAFCFVQHSITTENGNSEGTPVAILEAQAAGLPVIATRHAGIQDVVLHEKTGLLCAEKDVSRMAEYMQRLFADKKLAQDMGAQGRERIREHFSLERHIRILDNLVERCVNP
ncbi:glycosyltransferase [candidate division KSB3 bacterium]|uniref:Glycosyltransferase n=1 Tax=candidate division KSB3 bacterium TaxID=2044937 RepID=A0A9D5Q486_9BACT|nr:glycosyltransferase [candidate division KSB3 bacterium]